MAAALLISGCTSPAEPAPSEDEEPEMALLNFFVVDQSENLVDSGSKPFLIGTQCLEALKEMTSVQTEEFAFGTMVTGVAGIQAPNGYYWALYIDNQYSNVGIRDCRLYSNKLIMWKLEQIQSSPPLQ